MVTPAQGVFDTATDTFVKVFTGYQSTFFNWGQSLFFTLLLINFSWLCLQYAFEKSSLESGLASFLRRFFVILFFYTLMLNTPWLYSLIHSADVIGKTLAGHPLTPSSIITDGLAIGGLILKTAGKASILTSGTGVLVALITYGIMLYAFFSIAIDLAATIITAWWLAIVSALFLGFAGLDATRNIARHYLDALLGVCMKLVGIYLVVAIANPVIKLIHANVPTSLVNLDPYGWLIAAAILFKVLAKNFPMQLAGIMSHAVKENQGADAGAIAMGAARMASHGTTAKNLAATLAKSTGVVGLATVVASTVANATARMGNIQATGGTGGGSVFSAAAGGAMRDLGSAIKGTLSGHAQSLKERASGKPAHSSTGGEQARASVAGVAERLHASTQTIKKATEQGNNNVSRPRHS